ncbi:MAG: RNA polymerase sigma factor [Chloroflexia bacterium]|nr:RNA polymerase sigma factor [Chloroflexia bacterium]
MRYTKDYSAAEDVLQEGFIKIFTNISSYKGTGAFEGWMRRVVINTALERFRKQFQMYPITEINESEFGLKYENILSPLFVLFCCTLPVRKTIRVVQPTRTY